MAVDALSQNPSRGGRTKAGVEIRLEQGGISPELGRRLERAEVLLESEG